MKANPANLLSLGRIFLTFVAVFLLLEVKEETATIIAVGLIAIAVLLDAIDGLVARALGFADEVGGLTDLQADHIMANAIWTALAFLSLVSVWAPLITTTRDLTVDLFRQAGSIRTGQNGFEQIAHSRLRWAYSSRTTRALYGGLKLLVWGWALLSVLAPTAGPFLQAAVWITVGICLFRAIPCLATNWKYVVTAKA